MQQSDNAIRTRNSSSPHSSHCPSMTKNHCFEAVVTQKTKQTKRKRPGPPTAAMPRSRKTAPRVRFSHTLVQALEIPRIDDEETKSRLYYSAMEIDRFVANERIRRQLLVLTVVLYKEQIKRIIHRHQLMPAYMIIVVFQKMLSRIGMIAASAPSGGGASSAATRKIGATTTILEMPSVDDSAERTTKRCRVEAENTNTRQSTTPPRRTVCAQCA